MYFETFQHFIAMLNNLSGILDKAARYAEARKFDPNNLLTARLAPDMYPLLRQVQLTCDGAKSGAARLTGQDPPRHEDNEKTLPELKERIAKCVAYLSTYKPEHFHGAAERHINLGFAEGKYILGKDFIHQMAIPNFYFHLTTTYALLRLSGVEVGKADYLGALSLHDK